MRRTDIGRSIIFRRVPRMTVREVATKRPVLAPRRKSVSLCPIVPVQFPWAYRTPHNIIITWFRPWLPIHPYSW